MKIRDFIYICLLLWPGLMFGQEDIQWNQKDADGSKTGPWRAFHQNGELRYMGKFKADVPRDTFFYYYPDGKLKSLLIYHPDTLHQASAIHFYQTGDTMAQGIYLKQKKSGIWMTYGANSIPLNKGLYQEDKKEGRWVTYFPEGQIAKEVHYQKNIEDGPYKTYFVDGQLKEDSYYLDGALHGVTTFYDQEGKKRKEGKYREGQRVGKWYIYDEDGELDKVLEYENGKLLNPEVLEEVDYDTEEYQNQRKDQLEFEDLRGRIKYE